MKTPPLFIDLASGLPDRHPPLMGREGGRATPSLTLPGLASGTPEVVTPDSLTVAF